MLKGKKILALAMGMTLAFGSIVPMAACERTIYDEKIDKTKTTLIISNYDGGFGTDWLYDVETDFESLCEGISFEEGRRACKFLSTLIKRLATSLNGSSLTRISHLPSR